ncbi:hypothetical protein R3W88_008476 [Solanum pinnatisectum]|uniref:Uncharacterized protein n=1 Tax=Solanum pinnatisectum TaxID=50273 RepID=A0AAV9M863_9SOLN|nr:hypothetical protein R3W88_008476 [Solanum pinnatisectum]
MKNYENQLTESTPFPEVNEVYIHHARRGKVCHHARDCRTPKHLAELFQESLKKKEKNPEANFISEKHTNITHLDVANFFAHPEGKIDHLIGAGYVVMKE